MVKIANSSAGVVGSIPGSGRSTGEEQPTPVFLSGKISWSEEPGRFQSMACQKSWTDLVMKQQKIYRYVLLIKA